MAITPNTLSASWRVALAAAHEALVAGARCPAGSLPPDEVQRRSTFLVHEREVVADLLEADARVCRWR